MKNKIKKLTAAAFVAVSLCVFQANAHIAAESASEKVTNAVTNAGNTGKTFLNTVGGIIAGLISGITGIAALAIAAKAMWETSKNKGANSVWDEYASVVFVLVIVAAVCGFISAAFFTA
jgi:uncharacterized BrkB/YihY/UPF0761 family membrane protein